MANQVKFSSENGMFNHQLRAPVDRSLFDLSYNNTFTADWGKLYPIYHEWTVPNDDFTIKQVVKLQTVPLESPVFTAINIRTYYFYVPYYLLWHKFYRFLSGGKDGTYEVIPPIYGDSDTGCKFERNSLADYFGLPVDVDIPADDSPLAFMFMAYHRIYRDYFLNQDVQTEGNVNNWFPEDDFDFQLKDGFQTNIAPNDGEGEAPIELNSFHYVNWLPDYFTSAMPWPQRGQPIAMPVNLVGSSDASIPVEGSNNGHVNYLLGSTGLTVNMQNAQLNGDTYVMYTLPYIRAGGEFLYKDGLQVSKDSLDRYLSSSSGGFLIDDLRLATQLQMWLERNMRTKAQYKEFLEAHFNDSPLDERLTKPYYIGGDKQQVLVSEILQTSETTESSPMGSMAGTGRALADGYIGRFHSHEYGCIIGLMAIMPDTQYQLGMDRRWNTRGRFDWYYPEFSQLSPQAILNRELKTVSTHEDNEGVFGYQGRFDEYRHRRNMVCGDMRDPSKQDFYSWTLSREFENVPTLSSEFLSSKNTVRHDVFTTGTTQNPFIVQCGFDVRAVRPLPKRNVPMSLL